MSWHTCTCRSPLLHLQSISLPSHQLKILILYEPLTLKGNGLVKTTTMKTFIEKDNQRMLKLQLVYCSHHQSIHNRGEQMLEYKTGACTGCEYRCQGAQFNPKSIHSMHIRWGYLPSTTITEPLCCHTGQGMTEWNAVCLCIVQGTYLFCPPANTTVATGKEFGVEERVEQVDTPRPLSIDSLHNQFEIEIDHLQSVGEVKVNVLRDSVASECVYMHLHTDTGFGPEF